MSQRQFAIPKQLGLADRIANASHARLSGSSWQRQTVQRNKASGRDKRAK